MGANWHTYYKNTKSLKPSKFLMGALKGLSVQNGSALDLGCGAGRDTRYLLEQGFEVTAIDKDTSVKRYIDQLPHQDKLNFICTSFEDFTYDTYDVVNAHYSLPFTGKKQFTDVMQRVTGSIKPGGLFVGQLFGTDDEWNTASSRLAFHTRGDVEKLFITFETLHITETNEAGTTADGSAKHWHVFNVVALKSPVKPHSWYHIK